ncbi:aminotransferase-like domain-containing protein [Pseudochelatococcus sp. B33]
MQISTSNGARTSTGMIDTAGRLPIDLSRSVPPVVQEFEDLVRLSFAQLAQTQGDIGERLRLAVLGGTDEDREIAAQFLSPRFGHPIDPGRIIVGNGTQNLLTLLLAELVGRGGLLLSEELTYTVLSLVTDRAGINLRGIAIDDGGLRSDAFADSCKRLRPKALYCNPTVQNPTTAIMPLARRLEIAEIARANGVAIIEDDVQGCLHNEAPPPVAAIAPDVTWYIMGLTKCVAHSTRIAYLVAPSAAEAARLMEPIKRLSMWSASPLSTVIINWLIRTNRIDAIVQAIRDESHARQALAVQHLPSDYLVTKPGALHLWLRLPAGWNREDFARMAEERGVLMRPADRFAVPGATIPEAVRLSLSSPEQRSDVELGLRIVTNLLDGN